MVPTRRSTLILAAALAALLVPRATYADLRATAFGGASRITETDKGTIGAAVTFGGLLGLEFDAARINLGTLDVVRGIDAEAHLTTYMGNLVVRTPTGRLQAYGSAGVGLVRATGTVQVPVVGGLSASAQDVGWNVGGGLYFFPSDHVGIRGDVRRFQTGDVAWEDIGNVGDLPLPEFDFWRATVGVTIKF